MGGWDKSSKRFRWGVYGQDCDCESMAVCVDNETTCQARRLYLRGSRAMCVVGGESSRNLRPGLNVV